MRASDDTFDIAKEKFISNINSIDTGKEEEATDLKSLTLSIFDEIDNMDLNDTSIKIGWSNVDKRCTLDIGDLIIIAARPAMGKSAYALNMAIKLCKQEMRGLLFSLEMDKRQVMKRALSCESNVPLWKIKEKCGQKHLTDLDREQRSRGGANKNNLDVER